LGAAVFERYTERARLTIYHAKYESLRRGLREIQPKDIVLGLTRDSHQPGCPFELLYVNAESIRSLVDSEPLYGPPENWDIPLSLSSKKVLAYAESEAKLDRRYSIGSDHLLRGVLRLGDEIATKMEDAGYDLTRLREASREAHRLNADAVAPFWWRVKGYSRLLLFGLGLLLLVGVVLYLRSQN
jgi:ATP-dependent Clp protease ATP-binding subunit ClpA